MRSRVIPGSLVTMERRVPVKRLKSVDLPTLGRPTMTSDGRSSGIGLCDGRPMGAVARNAIFQCSAFLFTRVEGVHPRHFFIDVKGKDLQNCISKMFDSRRDIFGSATQANAEKRRLKKGK